jgi:hypothetical protein
MLDAISKTSYALKAAHRLSVRARAAAGRFHVASAVIGMLLIAMVVDAVLPLHGFLRGLTTVLIAVSAYTNLARYRRESHEELVRLDRAAALVETGHPEWENALINAVQLSRKRETITDEATATLIDQELIRAEALAERMPLAEMADVSAVTSARNRMFIIAGIALAIAVFYPRIYRFELPRMLLFWQDRAPFTLTDFHLEPKNAHVKPGGSIEISLTTSGVQPSSVSLVTAPRGAAEQSTPMFARQEGGYNLALEDIRADTDYYVRANTGRSERYHITVDQAPKLKEAKVTLTAPAYTKRQPETSKLGADGIQALYGTQIRIEVESTQPLSGSELVLTVPSAPEEHIALATDLKTQTRAAGQFTLRRAGAFRIDLRGATGLLTASALTGKLELLRDENPIVYMTIPGQNAVVTPDMAVTLTAEAEDDVGVQKMELHRIVNEIADSQVPFTIPPGQRQAEASVRIDLKELGARPGDVIQYYASAADNDPGRPHITDSERNWLWVVSKEDYAAMRRKQRGASQIAQDYRAQTDQLHSLADDERALADAANKNAEALAKNPNDPEAKKQAEQLKAAQEQLRKDAENLAKAMEELSKQEAQIDIEKGLQKKMAEMAQSLRQTARGPMKSGAQPNATPQQTADAAKQSSGQLDKLSNKAKETVERALDSLEKLNQLYQDVERLKKLAKQQGEQAMQGRELAQNKGNDPTQRSRAQKLSEEQHAAAQELRRLAEDLMEHGSECEGIAPGAAEAGKKLSQMLSQIGADRMMDASSGAFGEPNAKEGADQAERAKRALDSLMSQGGKCQGGAKQGLDKESGLCLGQGAGDSLGQLGKGQGNGNGQGEGGSGMGGDGNQAPKPGTRPGGNNGQSQGQQSMVMALQQQSQSQKSKRTKRHIPGAERVAEMAAEQAERDIAVPRQPVAASDAGAGRYPVEYKVLVKDYFKAVSSGK